MTQSISAAVFALEHHVHPERIMIISEAAPIIRHFYIIPSVRLYALIFGHVILTGRRLIMQIPCGMGGAALPSMLGQEE